MKRLAFVAALGLGLGFAVTARSPAATACSCVGFRGWRLALVDASPGIDRAAWSFADTYLHRSVRYSIHSPGQYELYAEVK